MSPHRAGTARSATLTALLAVALASTAFSLTAGAADAGDIILAYSDEALPGEGRPPAPGPTDPDGAR
jgi:hypothetical protein